MPSPFQNGGAEECVDVAGTGVSQWQKGNNNHVYIPEILDKVSSDAQTTLAISPSQDVLGIESSHHGKCERLRDHTVPGHSNSSAYLDKYGVRWENDCSILKKAHAQTSRESGLKNLPSRSFIGGSDLQFCMKTSYFDSQNMYKKDNAGGLNAVKFAHGDPCFSPVQRGEKQQHSHADSGQQCKVLSSGGHFRYRSSSNFPHERQDSFGSPQSILHQGIFSNSARVLTTQGRSIPALTFGRSTCPSVGETEDSVDFEVACSEEGDREVSMDSLNIPAFDEESGVLIIPQKENGYGRKAVLPESIDSMDGSLGNIGAFSSPRHDWSAGPVNFEPIQANSFVNKRCQQKKLSNAQRNTKGIVDRHGVCWTGDFDFLTNHLDSNVSDRKEVQLGQESNLPSCPRPLVNKNCSSWKASQTLTLSEDALPTVVKSDAQSERGCQTQLQLFNSCDTEKKLIHVPAQTGADPIPMDSGTETGVDDVVNQKLSVACSPRDDIPVLKLNQMLSQKYGWTEVRSSWSFTIKVLQRNLPFLIVARTVFQRLVAVLKAAGGRVGGLFWNAETGHGS